MMRGESGSSVAEEVAPSDLHVRQEVFRAALRTAMLIRQSAHIVATFQAIHVVVLAD